MKRFNLEYLNELLNKVNAVPSFIPNILNRDSKITFICSCGKSRDKPKTFRDIEKSGAYCHDCIYEKANEQRKQTVREIYGENNVSKVKEIQDKKIETSIRKYGTEHPSQSELVMEKIKQTNLEVRGVEHSMQDPNVIQKVKDTNLKNHGVSCSFQREDVKIKTKETLERNFGPGIINPFMSEVIKELIKQTNLKKLGVEYPGQAESVK